MVALTRRNRFGVGVRSNAYGSQLCTSVNSKVATDGRWTGHISVGEGDRRGPVLGRIENGPQHAYHEKRGGPVHHMMVGPQHVTHEAQQEKLPAQSRT